MIDPWHVLTLATLGVIAWHLWGDQVRTAGKNAWTRKWQVPNWRDVIIVVMALILFVHLSGFKLQAIHWPAWPWNVPTPTPVPPGPPAPIPAPGLHVLVIYESADISKYPSAQASVLTSSQIRDYLNANCPVGADGKTKEWRILDQNTDMSAESVLWQNAMKLPHTTLPWIVVSNGTSGFSGPLPADVTTTLTLIGKYKS